MEDKGPLLQKIEYYREVRPPTLKQYVYRRAVREKMAELKGQTGVTINPETGRLVPVSAISAREVLRGLSAEQLLQQHPEWQKDYEQIYGTKQTEGGP